MDRVANIFPSVSIAPSIPADFPVVSTRVAFTPLLASTGTVARPTSTSTASVPAIEQTPRSQGLYLAPDFALPDHRGGTYRLSDRSGSGPLVLVFFRGHWCPYCRRYLTKLRDRHTEFVELGAEVVAVSPENSDLSRRFADELTLPFPLLSDTEGRVIDAFGVRNSFSSARTLLPHPAVIILSPDRQVLFRSIDRNYKKRTTLRTILAVLRPPPGAHPQAGAHPPADTGHKTEDAA